MDKTAETQALPFIETIRNECYNGFCIVQIISFLWFGFADPDRCNGWGRFFLLVTLGYALVTVEVTVILP